MTSSQNDPNVYTSNPEDPRTSAIAPVCTSWERGRPVRKVLEWTGPWHVWALAALVGLAAMSGWTKMALTQNATVTLISTGDTTLKQGTPNSNQGAETLLHIQQGGTQRALVRFDQQALEQAIGNSSIRSAKLRLFIAANGNNWGTDGREVNVHRLTQAWTEAGATWNCPNDTNTSNSSADCSPGWEMGGSSLPPFAIAPTHVLLHQNNQTGWVEWDVTGDVRKFLAHEVSNYGWIIRKDDEGASGQVDYASRENTNPPQLVIELGEPAPPGGAGLTATSDADVRSGSPNQNQGNRMRLQAQSSGTNRVLVQFDRQAMLATVGSGTLQTAKLRLYVMSNANNWGSSGRAVNVHRMTQAWTEQGTTWNCPNDLNPFNSQSDCTPTWSMGNSSQWPFVATPISSMVQQNNQTGWVEWDVTAGVAQILANSVPNYGWLIRKDNEGQAGQVEYGSRESQYKPELRLTVQGANNQAPQVSAGADQTITLPSTASLAGMASDDGLPSGSSLSYSWSQVSGPGTASFNNPSSAETTVAFTLPGTYALKLTVSDSQLSTTDEVAVVVNPPPPVNQAPQVSAGPDQTITLPVTASLNGSASDDGLPAGGMLSSTWSVVGNPAPVTFGNANQPITTATFTVAGSYVLRLTASDSLLSSSDDVTITVNPPSQQLPPDPVTVAPPLDRTVATTLLAATQFLYTGSNPIQTGVTPGTISPIRAAVLRGKVITRDGLALPGVKIAVLNHPEFGETLSRADGMFDLAVNGGSLLTVNYEKAGLLPAQRQVNVPWQNYAWLPTVALIPYDTQITSVDLGSNTPIQIARGSVVTDLSGSRQTSLFFRNGTAGTLVLADGSTQPISNLHVRVTEYTVGPRGNFAMPAELPPNSAYTHCVALTTDEAVAVAASSVRFSQPVLQYVENYQGFPTGTLIPEGYYDREKAAWVSSDNGVVVHILAITSGEAILDVDGSNTPATPQAYSALGITGAERQQLAALYQPGQSLWRIPVSHFSDWDSNMGYSSPSDSRTAGVAPPSGDNKTDCTDVVYSSIIECQNQVLRQNIPLTGTPFSLHYSSDRVPGRKSSRTLEIPLSGAVVPSSLKAIDLEIQVMGRQFNYGDEMAGDVIGQSFPPAPQQTFAFEWDGKDAYGRSVQGEQRFKVRIGYRYDAVYQAVPRFGYNGNGIRITQNGTLDGRREVTLWQDWLGGITFNEEGLGTWDSRPLGLGGWDLSIHHSYDPIGRKLYLGNGSERSVSVVNPIQLVAGSGPSSGSGAFSGDGGAALQARLRYPDGIAIAPDGGIYIADSNNSRIRRVGADRIITTVVGGNVAACSSPTAACGDGGPAILARLGFPEQIQFGTDGSLYIADASFRRIRKVSPDGTISTIAGTGVSGFSGDGGLATQANLRNVQGLALAPDGSLYIGDTANHRIRRVSTDGLITTVAGTGIQGYSGDGGPAVLAQLAFPTQLAVGSEGAVYFADEVNHRIRKIGVDGLITTVTGGPTRCFPPTEPCGDGGPAQQATLNSPGGLAFGPDGSLYVSDTGSQRIRRITPTGVMTTVAGGSGFGYSGDGGASNQALLFNPKGIAVSPDASLYFADQTNHRVRKVSMALPDFTATEIVIPDESGNEVYVFDAQGRHLRTQDAFTNGVLYQFSYDAAGLLSTVADGSGNVTTVERNGSNPTAIVGPYGQRTTLTTDTNGYLAGITNPANESQTIVSTTDGLMNTFRDPKGQLHQFQYTAAGRLMRDAGPAGGLTNLERQATTGTDYTVTRTTALGHPTQYNVENLTTGEERQTTTYPDGTQSVSIRGPDGRVRTTMPGGETTESLSAPDPRWNLMAPFGKSSTVTTPEGLFSTVTTSRTVSLGNPTDPFTLTSQTDSMTVNSRTFTRVFDAATRTSTTTTPEARQSSHTVDLLGRIIRTQLASLHPVQFSYDSRGRLQSTNQGTGSDTRSVTFGYNTSGYIETVTDPLLRVTRFEYDAVGRVNKQTLPGNREIQFNYDANGNLTSLTPPGKPQHAFDYTEVDLMKEYDPPTAANVGTRVTTYAYDNEHKPTLITRPDGQTIDFDYDTAGSLSSLNLPGRQLAYGYHATTGNLTSITDSTGSSLAYTYDGSLPKSSTWTGSVSGNVAWNYDNNFRITSRSINGANAIDFGYDNDSLLTQSGALTLSRHPQNGLLTGTTLGNVTDSWNYNNFAEPVGYAASVAGTPVYSKTFTRDKLGRITSKIETLQGVTDNYVYGYDTAGRLETVTKNGSLFSSYTYDTNGNRLTRTTAEGIATYTTDNQDRLTTWNLAPDTWNLTYTANGELQTKTNGSETTTYQYDVVGNLRHVTLPDGTQIDYVIDAQNRRVGKKVNGVLVQGWLYGNQLNPIAELDGSNQIVSTFIYGSRGNVPDYMVKAGVTYRIISDHLGSPRLIVNTANGTVAQRLDFDEFGQITQDTNPGFQPFTFAGGLCDPQTKLIRFGSRDYDSSTGRWAAKDWILFAGGDANLYGYVLNDPVNLIDPEGRYNWYYHYWYTYYAELVRGQTMHDAAEVAESAADADFLPNSQSVASEFTNMHGMAGMKPNGQYQTAEEARRGTWKFINQHLRAYEHYKNLGLMQRANYCLGLAYHALLDIDSRGHQFSPWDGGSGPHHLPTWKHFLQDLIPYGF